MQSLLTTILHRPYVFAFLIAFLVLGRIYWGWRRTFLWLVIGYVIAWASEYSSIHNGFPYGLYHYIYENMQGELMVAGVPFWDSLSYPFMIFAGYTTARFILCVSLRGATPRSNLPSTLEFGRLPRRFAARNDILATLLGALLTMLLDIIIDPLTVLGNKWFLGQVYYYPNGGGYFGVPLTNFAGWFLVPMAVILLFQLVIPAKAGIQCEYSRFLRLRRTGMTPFRLKHSNTQTLKHFLNPLFYLSIALFNIAITMWINEPLLASIDCFLLMPVVGLLIWRIRYSLATGHRL